MHQISNDRLIELARDAGLPISWWERAKAEGEHREWRELKLFAKLVAEECASMVNNYIEESTFYDAGNTIRERFGIE